MTHAGFSVLDPDNPHRRLIETIYASRRTRRSKVPHRNHIDEGLMILQALQATQVEAEAFCLHAPAQISYHFGARPTAASYRLTEPQGPRDTWLLQTRFPLAADAVALAWRFAVQAEAFRPNHLNDEIEPPSFTIDTAVRKLLIADKVQNRKDFERYHRDSHPRAPQLTQYFACWFALLEISEHVYQKMLAMLAQKPS